MPCGKNELSATSPGNLADNITDDHASLWARQIATVQTVAGTGANRIGAAFLKRHLHGPDGQPPVVYVGEPAWPNYRPLFENAGFPVRGYDYLDQESGAANVEAAVTAMQEAPKGSIFVLQACCHNPTGVDYDREQWKRLAEVIGERHHFAFFDAAYVGFGSGKKDAIEDDSWPIRYFVEQGVDMLACQSFSKIMGLYSERVGALHVVCSTSAIAENVLDQLRAQIRWEVSSSPAWGARLADIILQDKDLTTEWKEELSQAAGRIEDNRRTLHHLLTQELKTPGSWDHILREKGLFSLLHLQPGKVEELLKRHLYLPPSGRINVAGLSSNNIEQAAKILDEVVKS